MLALLSLLVGTFFWYSFRQPLPQTDGALWVQGLREEVRIYRDPWGVPHLYAANSHDLFWAQGYTHAQDRWWQMETHRQLGLGNLSSLAGNDPQIQALDHLAQGLDWPQAAQADWAQTPPRVQAVLLAYSEGVNAYISDRSPRELAVEYTLLDVTGRAFQVQPWEPWHTLAWALAFSWMQSGNFVEVYQDLVRQSLNLVGDPLYPRPPGAITLPSAARGWEFMNGLDPAQLPFLERPLPPRSTVWAIAANQSDSGFPLLAADWYSTPQIPSLWYNLGLHCAEIEVTCPYNLVGFSLAGLPGILMGHNGHLAWVMSHHQEITQEIRLFTLNPSNPGQYQNAGGGWQNWQSRQQDIPVRNADPLRLQLYSAEGYQIISEVSRGDTVALGLKWRRPRSHLWLGGLLALNRAQTWEEAQATLLQNWDSPPLNLLYADTEGRIAHFSLGLAGGSQLESLNPPEGYLLLSDAGVFWVGGEDTPALFSRQAPLGDYLQAANVHNMNSLAFGQGLNKEPLAAHLWPSLMALDFAENPTAQDYQTWLQAWDFSSPSDSPYALWWAYFWDSLVEILFDDHQDQESSGGLAEQMALLTLLEADQADHPWWDDSRTPEVIENRTISLMAAFVAAIEAAENDHGPQRARWQWGDIHTATFSNPFFGESNIASVADLLNRPNLALGGSHNSPMSSPWGTERAHRYQVLAAPTARLLLDLRPPLASQAILSTGQSGHPASPHYDDMLDLWRNVHYYDLLWEPEAIRAASQSVLILRPALPSPIEDEGG
jgi:penicillin amidase